MPAGTIYTIDSEDAVIIKNDAGIVTLTRESFAVNPEGMLMALYFVRAARLEHRRSA